MTGIFGTLCTLLFVFFGNEVFAIFVPEQAAYEAGGVFLRIDGYSQLFMMLEITMQGVFYGIGRTIPPAIISISCNYMRIPLAYPVCTDGYGSGRNLVGSLRHHRCQRFNSFELVHYYQKEVFKYSFNDKRITFVFLY